MMKGKNINTLIVHKFFLKLKQHNERLAHKQTNKQTVCNSPRPPLADIVLFELSLSGFPSRFLKRVYKGEISTPL